MASRQDDKATPMGSSKLEVAPAILCRSHINAISCAATGSQTSPFAVIYAEVNPFSLVTSDGYLPLFPSCVVKQAGPLTLLYFYKQENG